MGSFSIWHWMIVLAVMLLVFGTGRISTLMGDVAKGVKAFKKGLEDDEPSAAKPVALLADQTAAGAPLKDEACHP
ncbi:MAG TPA: twin-arginine translocase TatA/TatE family subunit [Magnetospirillaceae bacterium]|nr:twin-arginine translocase TatA/TatE family subunit [Magnetospirillaceae bacterium]